MQEECKDLLHAKQENILMKKCACVIWNMNKHKVVIEKKTE